MYKKHRSSKQGGTETDRWALKYARASGVAAGQDGALVGREAARKKLIMHLLRTLSVPPSPSQKNPRACLPPCVGLRRLLVIFRISEIVQKKKKKKKKISMRIIVMIIFIHGYSRTPFLFSPHNDSRCLGYLSGGT